MEHIHIIINLNVFSLKQAFYNYGWLYLSLVYKRYIQVYWCALTFKSEHKKGHTSDECRNKLCQFHIPIQISNLLSQYIKASETCTVDKESCPSKAKPEVHKIFAVTWTRQ